MSGKSIRATLELNTGPFLESIEKTKSAVNTFKNSLVRFGKDSKPVETGILEIQRALNLLLPYLQRFKNLTEQTQTFNRFANGLKTMAIAVREFSSVTNTSQVGMIRIKEIISQWSNAVKGLQSSLNSTAGAEQQEISRQQQIQQALANSRNSFVASEQALRQMASAINSVLTPEQMHQQALANQRNSAESTRNALMQLAQTLTRLEGEENKASATTDKASNSIRRQGVATSSAVANTNRLASSTSRLGRAMSSLRMMGSMVGSMLAYNFAHKLLVATGETIHAKSEMEGYFKMLHFGQSEIDGFNKALDSTVSQFQRVNKYSLGETISSIGVEFNLTTQEMEKAMKVTSMITSEYLRAGRNANEASLAVKDVLQGQFQRLSRETGVKGEDLKEAGWSGDTKDVLGLMKALEKVAHDRNWDVFAEKANSLNDVLTIIQNRFGEWSADMVNSVQPTIVGVFNAIMDVGGMLAQSLGGIWNWFTGGSWEASATQIGLVTSAVLVLSQAFVMYRSQLGLVQASQLGLKGSIMSVITGLKGQQVAEMGVRNSIMAKILGVKAETLAESGVARAIEEKLAMTKLETVEQQLNTLSSKENSVAKMESALQTKIAKAELEGLITVEEADTLRKELNTAMTEANALASLKQAGVNGGLTTTFIMLAGAENATAVATGEISVAMGVLNGIMAMSPIGWLTAGIMALAGAFYVLSGGLDAHWDKMKTFNDTLDNSKDIVKANKEHLKELKDTLGEDSEEYKNASESVKTFNSSLKASKKLVKEYNQELDSLPVKLGEITSANSKGLGISEDGMKELSEYATGLQEGHNTYYRALQVLHKQEDDFDKSERTLAKNMQDRYASEEDVQNKRMQHLEHYQNFMKHSAEHNTSDDWWGGTWAGMLAGIDSAQIWLDYKTEDLAQWWHDFTEDYSKLPQQLSDAWNNIDWGALGDIGGRFSQWIDDVGTSLSDSWKSLTEMFDNNIKKPITDWWNNFISFDWLFGAVSASDGSSDHPSFMEDLSAIFGFDIQAWIDSFMADPLGTLGIDLSGFDIIGTLANFLFGSSNGDPNDIDWVMTFLQNNIITPLTTTWNMIMTDPLAYLGDMGFTVTSFLDGIFGTDVFTQIWDWTYNTIVQPFSQSLWSGIMSIPLVSDILQLFGLADGENTGSSQKGKDIGEAFKRAIEDKIRNIPIVGDILQLLGLIPQTNDDAHSKGKGVGENVDKGYKDGTSNLVSEAIKEFQDIANGIRDKAGEAYGAAKHYAGQVWEGLNSVFQRASPGFFHDQVLLEFGTDMPNAMVSSGSVAYSSAQYYAQQVSDGISSVNTDSISLDTAVGNYETDAQMIAMSSQMMGMTTTTAFNDMSLAVNNTTAMMSSNVGTTYSQMQTKQASSLNTMKTQNLTAYNDMYLKSNQSLINMRDSTSNITHQMISAWTHMKNQLVATANQLRNESTSHFNRLSDTIGSFYRKIQNPSNWGAGPSGGSTSVRGARNTSVGRSFARGMRTRGAVHGAGPSKYNGKSTMTIAQLKRMLCPTGNCGNIFDGFSSTDRVDVADFLASIEGEHGFGGWSDWDTTHFNYIKNKSDDWDMKSPVIQVMGGIPTNAPFKVGDFENGTPSISFDSFKSMAESIFQPGGIPYKHYMDSAWKGSWLGAIQAGACNCSDGAEAIIAFASACGFGGGQKVHGYWGNEGHFWAVINGEVFDTTAMQKGYGWRSPSVHGYGPSTRTATKSGDAPKPNKTINITVDMTGATIYGVDDLDNRISEGVKKGLEAEFNDPYTVLI